MSQQFIFSFPHHPNLTRDRLIIAPHNQQAVSLIDQYPHWRDMVQAIYGPAATGKKHLLTIWQAETQAALIAATELPAIISENFNQNGLALYDLQDLPPEAEESLFHLINIAREEKRPLLLSANRPLNQLSIKLPDLASRLAALSAIPITLPDDESLEHITRKILTDYQLTLTPRTISYLMPRVRRDPAFIMHFIKQLDQETLRQGKNINISQIAEVLAQNIDI